MARETAQYDLSDAEKRDLIKLIEQGKPLPEKYRFLLFADKREVELVWNGKSREACTAILPFQTLEHIDEPRKEQRGDGEFDKIMTAMMNEPKPSKWNILRDIPIHMIWRLDQNHTFHMIRFRSRK